MRFFLWGGLNIMKVDLDCQQVIDSLLMAAFKVSAHVIMIRDKAAKDCQLKKACPLNLSVAA